MGAFLLPILYQISSTKSRKIGVSDYSFGVDFSSRICLLGGRKPSPDPPTKIGETGLSEGHRNIVCRSVGRPPSEIKPATMSTVSNGTPHHDYHPPLLSWLIEPVRRGTRQKPVAITHYARRISPWTVIEGNNTGSRKAESNPPHKRHRPQVGGSSERRGRASAAPTYRALGNPSQRLTNTNIAPPAKSAGQEPLYK